MTTLTSSACVIKAVPSPSVGDWTGALSSSAVHADVINVKKRKKVIDVLIRLSIDLILTFNVMQD